MEIEALYKLFCGATLVPQNSFELVELANPTIKKQARIAIDCAVSVRRDSSNLSFKDKSFIFSELNQDCLSSEESKVLKHLLLDVLKDTEINLVMSYSSIYFYSRICLFNGALNVNRAVEFIRKACYDLYECNYVEAAQALICAKSCDRVKAQSLPMKKAMINMGEYLSECSCLFPNVWSLKWELALLEMV